MGLADADILHLQELYQCASSGLVNLWLQAPSFSNLNLKY